MPIEVQNLQPKVHAGNVKGCYVQEDISMTVGEVVTSAIGSGEGHLWVVGASVHGWASAWTAWYTADSSASVTVMAHETHVFTAIAPRGCVVDKAKVSYHRRAAGTLSGMLQTGGCTATAQVEVTAANGRTESIEMDVRPEADKSDATVTTTIGGNASGSATVPVGGVPVGASAGGNVSVTKTKKATIGVVVPEIVPAIDDDVTLDVPVTLSATTTMVLGATSNGSGSAHTGKMEADVKNEVQNARATVDCACETGSRSDGRGQDDGRSSMLREQQERLSEALASLRAAEKKVSPRTKEPMSKVDDRMSVQIVDLAELVESEKAVQKVQALAGRLKPPDEQSQRTTSPAILLANVRGFAWMLDKLLEYTHRGYAHDAAVLDRQIAASNAAVQAATAEQDVLPPKVITPASKRKK